MFTRVLSIIRPVAFIALIATILWIGRDVLVRGSTPVPEVVVSKTGTPYVPVETHTEPITKPEPASTSSPAVKPSTPPASIVIPPTPTPVAQAGLSECLAPKPEWIWCDDFEVNRFSSYFEANYSADTLSRVAGVGFGDSSGLKAVFQPGRAENGNLKIAFGRTPSNSFRTVDTGTKDYKEIYWRVYLKNQPGWTGGAGYKFSRAVVFANSNWAVAAVAPVWGGDDNGAPNYLILDPVSGTDVTGNLKTTKYNDFPNNRYLGAVIGTNPIFSSANVGKWYCIEAHMKLNDAGQSNAMFEYWIDGTLNAQKTSFSWVGSYSSYGINAIFLENYWNTTSPVKQERYFDNFVVSTSRIGCL